MTVVSRPASSQGSSRRIESRRRERELRSLRTAELLERAHATDNAEERRRLLDEVIILNLGVAHAVAARYRQRGVPSEDLDQAAQEGLVKAVQRFDPAQERDLLSYAVPTIRGEVQRHFRDRSWMVRPPRRVQELQWRINQTVGRLGHELGRVPEDAEVCRELGVSEESFREAVAGFGCFQPISLDQPVRELRPTLGEAIVADLADCGPNSIQAVEARLALAPALATLSERDRRIVYLRFVEEKSQTEIGAELGITQMQVSRLLQRILRDLRRQLGPVEAA
jgi:RNA polymerase sigma-B factor